MLRSNSGKHKPHPPEQGVGEDILHPHPPDTRLPYCLEHLRTFSLKIWLVCTAEFLRGVSFSAIFAIFAPLVDQAVACKLGPFKIACGKRRLFASTVFGLDSVSIGFAVCCGALPLGPRLRSSTCVARGNQIPRRVGFSSVKTMTVRAKPVFQKVSPRLPCYIVFVGTRQQTLGRRLYSQLPC